VQLGPQFGGIHHKVWIPDDAVELQQRLCVVAHAGLSGHRGIEATTAVLAEQFSWSTLRGDMQKFVKECLHWLIVGDRVVPRPYGPTLHATRPNEILHFDYLSLPESTTGEQYALVLKDDMSGFVELIACPRATAEETCTGLIDWFNRYGPVFQWISDRGTHFKNHVIDLLRASYNSRHHFTTAYCPWSNGTVEVVNRLLLRCMRALLSELRLHMTDWPKILPMVQAALNQMPADRLDGVAPVTAFTALPASSPVLTIMHPRTMESHGRDGRLRETESPRCRCTGCPGSNAPGAQ
jgi:transposase InsO family protein